MSNEIKRGGDHRFQKEGTGKRRSEERFDMHAEGWAVGAETRKQAFRAVFVFHPLVGDVVC